MDTNLLDMQVRCMRVVEDLLTDGCILTYIPDYSNNTNIYDKEPHLQQ